MADVPELHLVPNRSGSMSLVFEGREYKLRYTGKQKKHWVCSKDKKGCGGAIWTNLDVTSVIKQNDHIESCPVDEHLTYNSTVDSSHANLGYGWYFQGCTTMVSTIVYHPCLCGGSRLISAAAFPLTASCDVVKHGGGVLSEAIKDATSACRNYLNPRHSLETDSYPRTL
ncbi:hypothetical protein T11_10624 [Trichinella zimbabwensis]|uniref:FLYWCH-type domain-containing protein n=1 Tax=Trichinella zimbabwensis TaxID=268475 RepID=A0A0V1GU34_9BILA|nr:hypothetical protein T11_10624 [Trichinella zimbabwensis]